MNVNELNKANSDLELWESFLQGNNTAYKELYNRYVNFLFSVGLKYNPDEDIVKDSIHDLFVDIYRKRKKHKEVSNVRAYLVTALRNRLFNIHNREKRFVLISDNNAMEDDFSREDDLESVYIKEETAKEKEIKVKNILLQLSQRQREVIHFRFYEQMSINEISAIMNMNYQSVQNLLQRSINKIKKVL